MGRCRAHRHTKRRLHHIIAAPFCSHTVPACLLPSIHHTRQRPAARKPAPLLMALGRTGPALIALRSATLGCSALLASGWRVTGEASCCRSHSLRLQRLLLLRRLQLQRLLLRDQLRLQRLLRLRHL
ncbi:hypothetical protein TSOC_007209 [Tetrabaena socialis]|uniref:Uncharacterized protein n=1 Tax=Tetrabaena socialis TaxID=47790 RepID=A0A2J8A1P9_9CHLO|nr:hypothetical protein TSOC_007209 [Tetrabaena socialis]|eukprot:PNH06442.1 hypothetical protein TSOC_007209 [Tetrabaena socialis]